MVVNEKKWKSHPHLVCPLAGGETRKEREREEKKTDDFNIMQYIFQFFI